MLASIGFILAAFWFVSIVGFLAFMLFCGFILLVISYAGQYWVCNKIEQVKKQWKNFRRSM